MRYLLKSKRKNLNKLVGNRAMQKRFKQYEVLKWASLFLEKYKREPKVAELLLQHHLGINRAEFFARMQEPVDHELLLNFEDDLINHAITGVPVQHLIGYEIFYGREFLVNQHVLIPRPETEELIEHVLSYVRKNVSLNKPLTIVDVGTGSGIIAITLALELENVNVYGTDISEKALEVAKQNAENLQADVKLFQGDFLTPIIEQKLKACIIVSNPPYIATSEMGELSDTVKNFDPSIALFAEEQGLGAYKKIVSQLPDCVNNTNEASSVFLEIGQSQGTSVMNILKEAFPESNPATFKDINQKDRIVHCRVNVKNKDY